MLDDFAAFLQREHDLGHLRIKDTHLAARQFLGLIKENLVWPQLMGIEVDTSTAKTTTVIEASVEMFLCYYRGQS